MMVAMDITAMAAATRVPTTRSDDDVLFPSPSFHSRRFVERRRNSKRGGGLKATIRSREQLWDHLFADPLQWWDYRLTKKNPKQPDFRHKYTLEGLWIDSKWSPSWIKEGIGTLDSCHIRYASYCNRLAEENETVQKLCKEGRLKDALYLVECMTQQTPIEEAPNSAYISLLKECAKRKMLREGKQVHALIVRSKCNFNIFLANHLVNMYSKCGSPLDASMVFNAMPQRNVFSWTAIISAYADNGKCEEAVNLYREMQKTGIPPDEVVFVVVLKACAKSANLETGRQIHSLILEKGFHLNMILQSALVDMYAKCGCLDDARELFNSMSKRDVVSWNAMITGYAQNGLGKEAIALYEQMKQDAMKASKVTFACVLKACADIGALEQGKQIHSLIVQNGFHLDMILQSALVDMYAKCGCLDIARELFNNMTERGVGSWNAMITGYTKSGLGMEAIALFEQMKQEGIHPDDITYICILSACSHSGLFKEGFYVFDFMCKYSDTIPTLKHYTCMVDLLGRAGWLAEAKDLIMKMPIQPDIVVWTSLLGAARNAGNAETGQHVFDHIMKLYPENVASYLLLIDIYTRVGRIDKVADMRKEMREKGMCYIPGCS